ncbi:hypothetical protein HMN09_00080600 [Mycena chlorophos]|uniref:Uncharacterized protein n=1 Tax=Mycena chlorophos TaxID=658473 RepID=A0A8H6WLH0_MYCCL|nr:hypothetical protein HMN09_00080600 [Mycena chlorophos]
MYTALRLVPRRGLARTMSSQSTTMSFALPDVSPRKELPKTPIPSVPDLWYTHKRPAPAPEPLLPKISVVSPDTDHSHNLVRPDTTVAGPAPTPTPTRQSGQDTGILEDISEDLGLKGLKDKLLS